MILIWYTHTHSWNILTSLTPTPRHKIHIRSCNKFSFCQLSLFSRLFCWHRFISHSSCYKTGCALQSCTLFSFPMLCSPILIHMSWCNSIQCVYCLCVCVCEYVTMTHVCECMAISICRPNKTRVTFSLLLMFFFALFLSLVNVFIIFASPQHCWMFECEQQAAIELRAFIFRSFSVGFL